MNQLNYSAHKTDGVNRTKTMRFYLITFTGKERDEETDYSYHGARYYDPETIGLWLSVAPIADKYPGISPYAYCAWNPVKQVDLNGCQFGDYYDKNGKWLGADNTDDKKVYTASSVKLNSDGFVVEATNREKIPLSNKELLDRATWVCGESGGSGEYITNRTQNAGDALQITDATVADYYASAINNMSKITEGGFMWQSKAE